MRKADKEALREILAELTSVKEKMEQLCDSHQEWMEERSDDTNGVWDNTPTGERASDDQFNFDDWKDSIESVCDEIEEEV